MYVNVRVIVRMYRCTEHTVYGDGLSSLSDVFLEVEAYQLGKHSDARLLLSKYYIARPV